MFGFAVVALVVCCQLSSGGASCVDDPIDQDDPTKDTELLFTFLVHRHGDRTITAEREASYSNNPDALLQAAQEIGYGQLTLRGRQTAYQLGEYIRERYNELLAPKFNRSEVYFRSTDFTRAKMTILSALSAIYPPVEPRWSETVNWEPVPYTTVPALYDYNTPFVNCPIYMDYFNSQFTANSTEMTKFSRLLEQVSIALGKNVSTSPLSVIGLSSVLEVQISLGVPLSQELEDLYDKIKEAADYASEVLYDQKENLDLQAGPLLNEFIEQAALIISGNTTQRLRIYSAHDFNVFAIQSIIHAAPKQGAPRYASALSLELRKDINTGEYVVLPVYLPTPGEPPVYLNIEGCDDQPCNYDQFLQITSPYVLDEDSWRTKCGWTKDFVLNESSVQ